MFLLVLFAYSGFTNAVMENYQLDNSLFEVTNNVGLSFKPQSPSMNLSNIRNSQGFNWGNMAIEFAVGEGAVILKTISIGILVDSPEDGMVVSWLIPGILTWTTDVIVSSTVPYFTSNLLSAKGSWTKGFIGSLIGECAGFGLYMLIEANTLYTHQWMSYFLPGFFSCIGAVISLNL